MLGLLKIPPLGGWGTAAGWGGPTPDTQLGAGPLRHGAKARRATSPNGGGLAAILFALLLALPVQAQEARLLDGFETLTPWTADASTDVSSAISAVDGHDGRAMRLTYDFNGKSGYAFAARALPLRIPDNWEISFWIRGQGPSNTLEIKFVDASGDNVHWRQVRGFTAPDGWTRFVIKKRQVTRAWGPNPDPTFRAG